MINVYRAITGSSYLHGGEFLYSGVSAEQIKARGICNSNGSFAQSGGRFMAMDETLRYVPGLPVFLDRSSAEKWLQHKQFRSREGIGGLAVLACAEIATNVIADGKIQVVRNTLNPFGDGDRVLSLLELEVHQSGEVPMREECFIPHGQIDHTTLPTTFLVPRAHHMDGTINFDLSPAFMNLADLQ